MTVQRWCYNCGDTTQFIRDSCESCGLEVDGQTIWEEAVEMLRCTRIVSLGDGIYKMCGRPIAPGDANPEGGLVPVFIHPREFIVPMCRHHLRLTKAERDDITDYRAFQGWETME